MFSIFCIGDSLVYGRGEIPSNGWAHRLKNHFENELIHKGVYNLGIPGDTSYSLKKRIKNELNPRIWRRKNNDKYIAIIQIGSNDSKSIINSKNNTTKIENFEKNIVEIINSIKSIVDEIVFVGLIPVDENKIFTNDSIYFSNSDNSKYNSNLKIICEKNNVHFIELYEILFKTNYNELLEDGIHPNSKGYDLIFNIILDELKNKKLLDN